jgi:hypothetical protein
VRQYFRFRAHGGRSVQDEMSIDTAGADIGTSPVGAADTDPLDKNPAFINTGKLVAVNAQLIHLQVQTGTVSLPAAQGFRAQGKQHAFARPGYSQYR